MNITKLLREPILYNYYLGYDNYRFIWARSFNRLIILSLKKQNNNIYLICKALQDNDSIIKKQNEKEKIDAIKEKRERFLQMKNITMADYKSIQ